MYLSKMYVKTFKEAPSECETTGGAYLLRGSFVRKSASGLYSFLPLGMRVLSNIEAIIRREMNAAGAEEIRMPLLQPRKIWDESDRYEKMKSTMAKVVDNQKHEFIITPTAEEMVVDLIRNEQFSYRNLPFNLYQIDTKVRDEIRPRLTLIRAKEFIMKDAYSFHSDDIQAKSEFENMRATYRRIFSSMGVIYKEVEADSGDMGGNHSVEFQMLCDCGEDNLIYCPHCHYAANVETAKSVLEKHQGIKDFSEVSTPNVSSIKDVSSFFKVESNHLVKSMLYHDAKGVFMLIIRGDLKIDDYKFAKRFPGAVNVEEFSSLDTIAGFVGPYNSKIKVYADESLKSIEHFICGANRKDYHYQGVTKEMINILEYVDVRLVEPGQACIHCGQHLQQTKGIEVGHVFILGTKYSSAMNLSFRDAEGIDKAVIMGCYGLGVSRLLQAVAEQSNDEYGVIWPTSIAPFVVNIIPAKDLTLAEQIGKQLKLAGISYVIDDRDERLGFKLKDAELIGYPIRLITNPKAGDHLVEFCIRKGREVSLVAIEDVVAKIRKICEL